MRTGRLLVSLLLVLPIGISAPRPLHAQGERQPLLRRRDLYRTGAVLALTAATMTLDRRIARAVRGSRAQGVDALQEGSRTIKLVNERSLFALSAGIYVVGRVSEHRPLASFGLHAAEAIALTAAAQTIIKGGAGRSRPFVTRNGDPFDFRPGLGFRDPAYRSLPSLHNGGSLAFASVLVTEVTRRHPGSVRILAPITYSVASLPGLGRMYVNKHWASDVVLGSAMGVGAGLFTARYHHVRPDNAIDRFALGRRP